MNVDFSSADLVAEKVWYDAGTGRLCLSAGAYQNGIPLAQIPDADLNLPHRSVVFRLGKTAQS